MIYNYKQRDTSPPLLMEILETGLKQLFHYSCWTHSRRRLLESDRRPRRVSACLLTLVILVQMVHVSQRSRWNLCKMQLLCGFGGTTEELFR